MNLVRRLAAALLAIALAGVVLVPPAHAAEDPVVACEVRAANAENQLDKLYKVEDQLRMAATQIGWLEEEASHYRDAYQSEAATNDQLRARVDRLRQKIRKLRAR